MKIYNIPLVFMFISSLLVGCSSHTTVILVDSDGKQNAVVVSTNAGNIVIDKAYEVVKISDKDSKPEKDDSKSITEIKEKIASTVDTLPTNPVSILLYFKLGTSQLTEESKKKLPTVKLQVDKRKPCHVNIIGHSDTSGREEYNIGISLKRAQVIEAWLMTQDLDINEIYVESYGESDLLVKTEDGVANAQNRRVEIFIR